MKNLPLLLNHTNELFSLWYNKELRIRAADKIKRNYFSDRRYLGSKDRKFIENIYFDMIKNLRLYEWQVREKEMSTELLVVHACKKLYGTDQNTEFNIQDKIAELYQNHEYEEVYPDKPEIRWSLPDVVWDRIKDHYSQEDLDACLPALLESPGVHIRTNTLRVTTPILMEKLRDVQFQLGTLSSEALRLEKYSNLQHHPAYRRGLFDFQDESSQLVAHVCNPKASDTVIDLCAGAGGKTLHLAALQGDKPTLIATDKYPSRLKELIIRAKRLGVRHIKLTPIEEIRNRYKNKANIVLIDAPCSGTGVYGRHPDRKWELDEDRLNNYINEQKMILDQNAVLVKSGGYIVYASCSIIPDENALQVENFLKSHPDFELISVDKDLREQAIRIPERKEKYLQILPHHFQSDGFFIAKMRKK